MRTLDPTIASWATAMLAISGCISADSDVIDATGECEEFAPGATIDPNLEVDPSVLAFMQAAADLTGTAEVLSQEVLTACTNVALDLGANDTWSGLELEQAISNGEGTGACDAAIREIERVLADAGSVEGTFAIAVTRGECRIPFDAQTRCDVECAASATCEPGSVETRCEPGSLSVICEGMCTANASCIGTIERPANCMGLCESTCVGECRGTCIAPDGSRTTDDPSCMGKCTSSCNGMCRGRCRIEEPAGISCGADVRCTGGCSGTYTAPACTTEYGPPACMVEAGCHAICVARLAADTECDPTHVDVLFDVESTPELQPLVATLEANLPPLIDAADRHSELALDASNRLADSGEVIADDIENLSGKSLACVGAAAGSLLDWVDVLSVSIQASVDVEVKATEMAD